MDAPVALRQRSRTDGFTLLEVAIAVAVLALAIVTAAMMWLSTTQTTHETRDAEIITMDLASAGEMVHATAYGSLWTYYPENQAIAQFTNLHLTREQIIVHYFTYNTTTLVNGHPQATATPWPAQQPTGTLDGTVLWTFGSTPGVNTFGAFSPVAPPVPAPSPLPDKIEIWLTAQWLDTTQRGSVNDSQFGTASTKQLRKQTVILVRAQSG